MNARAAVLLVLLPLACASRGPRSGPVAPAGGDAYRITAEELAASHISNLYDAIVQLRPMWLNPRSPIADGRARAQAPQYAVYLDRVRLRDLEALRNIPLADVAAVRLLAANQAMGEFQLDDMLGAIQVITRPRR